MKRWKRIAVAVFLLVTCGWIALRWAFPPFVPPALPEPNGYEGIIRAANMLATRTGFYREMDPHELAATVEYNRPALVVAREALTKQSCVPINWSGDLVWMEKVYYPQAQKPREVARAFAAEALQAHRDGDHQRALACGSDCIQLGQLSSHGGLIVDSQIGHVIYGVGLMMLRDQVSELSRDDCELLLNRLAKSEVQFESAKEIMRHERAFFRAQQGRFLSTILEFQMGDQLRETEKMQENISLKYVAMKRLLETHLALHMFQLDNNQYPASLDELAPKYLASVPADPFAKGPLIYRTSTDGYILYSIGPNGRNDGGIEQDGQEGDIVLDPAPESLQAVENAE